MPDSPERYTEKGIELLPDQKRSGIGVLTGLETAVSTVLEPFGANPQLYFNVTFFDSRCDIVYGVKHFIDAYMWGANVLFGPACEFSLGRTRIISGRC